MKVIHDSEHIPPEFRGAFVTIGNFDGVHAGHQAIFRRIVREAHAAKRRAVVITFEPHPKMVLHPERRPFYMITTPEEKVKLIAGTGIDAAVIIPFSREFAATTAEGFIRQILWEKLPIGKIFIGHDYTFGRGKEGNEDFLMAFGKKLGFQVEVINAFTVGDTIISSTRIRNAILDGDVKMAATFLGRPYNLVGTVIHGKHRGKQLGFPTANIEPDKVLIPARGVYAVIVHLGDSAYRGVLNIGLNPTFSDETLSIEVFIMDFDRDIYGQRIEVLFIDRIRPEIKFPGPEQLIRQIRQDIETAETILKPYVQQAS